MSELSDTILVIGLGSPIMSDDAIGLEVADEIERMGLDGVETRQEPVGGLDIIPLLWGYRNVIIVDAIKTEQYEPGTVMFFDPEDFDETIGDASAHDINLATGMRIGREVEPDMMPESVRFVAIEVEDIQTVHEGMTPKVLEAKPSAVRAVLHLIDGFRAQSKRD
ncbi:MAG: hydrogenase maturation protease [Candidatus Methanomethylophilaceae archaeon]